MTPPIVSMPSLPRGMLSSSGNVVSLSGMSPLVMISPLAVPRFTQQRSSFGVSPLVSTLPPPLGWAWYQSAFSQTGVGSASDHGRAWAQVLQVRITVIRVVEIHQSHVVSRGSVCCTHTVSTVYSWQAWRPLCQVTKLCLWIVIALCRS